MVILDSRLAGLALGLAVTAFASPSFAQKSKNDVSAARAAAIKGVQRRGRQIYGIYLG